VSINKGNGVVTFKKMDYLFLFYIMYFFIEIIIVINKSIFIQSI